MIPEPILSLDWQHEIAIDALTLNESINAVSSARVRISRDDLVAELPPPKDLLGKRCRVDLRHGPRPRVLHLDIIDTTHTDTGVVYLRLRGPMHAAKRCRRSFTFLETTVPVALEQILQRHGLRAEARLSRRYHVRPSRVQHDETDFRMFRRLCRWSGIFFFERHGGDGPTIVLADEADQYDLFTDMPFVWRPHLLAEGDGTSVTNIDLKHALKVRATHVRGYDYERPSVELDSSAADARDHVRAWETFELSAQAEHDDERARLQLEACRRDACPSPPAPRWPMWRCAPPGASAKS